MKKLSGKIKELINQTFCLKLTFQHWLFISLMNSYSQFCNLRNQVYFNDVTNRVDRIKLTVIS